MSPSLGSAPSTSPAPPAGERAADGSRAAGAVPIAGFYLLYFAGVGITLPFLPAYLKSLSLSGTQVGLLLGLGPLASLLAPPLWGHLADRFGRPERVLSVVALGMAAGFALLLGASRFGALVACLAVYSFFYAAVTPLIDSLALQRVAAAGGSFAHLRLFGSLGFVLSSSAFGFAIARPDRATVAVPLALMGAYFLWSFTLDSRAAPGIAPHPLAGLRLLGRPQISVLLAATGLHWLSCTPFHGTFSIHVTALGLPPSVVGTSAALGVLAEVGVMLLYPRFAGRISPPRLLVVACVASALRWAGMAVAVRPEVIVPLQLLHGLTFGAFYVAAIAHLGEHVPPSLRASGQALFASVTYGIGGLLGYVGSGVGYDLLGGHRLFAVAAGLELVAAAFAWALSRVSPSGQASPPP